MVVVSGSWTKNVATFPALAPDNMVISTSNNNNTPTATPTNMSAKAVLICRPNSHPFQERTLCLDQPVKIGRSVARARATATNAIFDCKVLSRNHALLWYEGGKFYLQDTKSSNGTFVNNNRLSTNEAEPHEVSSGDIVQFGVDVVENNRKVTHGCIIATLKLYLPDGKGAKASPSITEGNRQGYVPLDDLYRLNQILQEAYQREQCLETKLTALQNVVEEAKKSAEDSWQAYVGEERLLSRVAALENQLMQAGKNWGDDKFKEEVSKLQKDRITYQIAAKESLQKLINERVDALNVAAEHQRARTTAEQEVMLSREELEKAQKEIQQIAQILSEERKKNDEERLHLEQQVRELEGKLEIEQQNIAEYQNTIEQMKSTVTENEPHPEQLKKCNLIIEDDEKLKEEMIGENDIDADFKQTNGIDEPEQNHINLSVAPVAEQVEVISLNSEEDFTDTKSQDVIRIHNECLLSQFEDDENSKDLNDSVKTPRNSYTYMNKEENNLQPEEKETKRTCEIDSKTLKYQFQTVQNEYRKQIEALEQLVVMNKIKITELEHSFDEEKALSAGKSAFLEKLKKELLSTEQKWMEACDEVVRLKKLVSVSNEVDGEQPDQPVSLEQSQSDVSFGTVTADALTEMEEELVILKERYAQVNEEKLLLNKEVSELRARYTAACNRAYNNMFWYVAPLVLILVYLLFSLVAS